MGEASRDFITSIGKMGDKLVIMIDADRILSTEEMKGIAGSLEAASKEPAVSSA